MIHFIIFRPEFRLNSRKIKIFASRSSFFAEAEDSNSFTEESEEEEGYRMASVETVQSLPQTWNNNVQNFFWLCFIIRNLASFYNLRKSTVKPNIP